MPRNSQSLRELSQLQSKADNSSQSSFIDCRNQRQGVTDTQPIRSLRTGIELGENGSIYPGPKGKAR